MYKKNTCIKKNESLSDYLGILYYQVCIERYISSCLMRLCLNTYICVQVYVFPIGNSLQNKKPQVARMGTFCFINRLFIFHLILTFFFLYVPYNILFYIFVCQHILSLYLFARCKGYNFVNLFSS